MVFFVQNFVPILARFRYLSVMISWLQNPHAGFVIIAYLVAAIALAGFALLSWAGMRARDKELKRFQQKEQEQIP